MTINVLVADDDVAIREMLVELLERQRIGVYAVDDGIPLVEAACQRPYDLILSDNHMPGMNGVDALREIRRNEGPNKNTPALLMTGIPPGGDGSYWAEIERESRDLGVRETVKKPFSIESLITKIIRYAQK